MITFQVTSVEEIRQAFRESVEDYLGFCTERGEEPEKPFPGKFLVRLSPEQHARAFITAKRAGKSLNSWVAEQITKGIGAR